MAKEEETPEPRTNFWDFAMAYGGEICAAAVGIVVTVSIAAFAIAKLHYERQ